MNSKPSQPEKKCACPDKDCPCWSLPSHSQDKEPSPSQEEWEREFDARFTHEERGFAGEIISREVNAEHLGDVKSKLFPEIKNFIALTISQARASTLKEVEEIIDGKFNAYYKKHQNCRGVQLTCNPERDLEEMHDSLLTLLQEKGDKSNTKNI